LCFSVAQVLPDPHGSPRLAQAARQGGGEFTS